MIAKTIGTNIELRLTHLRPWSVRGLHLADMFTSDVHLVCIYLGARLYVHVECAHPGVGIGEYLGGYLGTV